MLKYLFEAVIIVVVIILLFRFIRRYTIIRINGDSMLPTYKDGQLRIMDRLFLKDKHDWVRQNPDLLVNRIFVIRTPEGQYAIKRLISISQTIDGLYLWFEGDNKDNSRDSREYGFLTLDAVLGEVVPFTRVRAGILRN